MNSQLLCKELRLHMHSFCIKFVVVIQSSVFVYIVLHTCSYGFSCLSAIRNLAFDDMHSKNGLHHFVTTLV